MSPDNQDKHNPNADRSPGELPPELRTLEAQLAQLAPRSDSLDTARLMFLAGRQEGVTSTATRAGRLWPAVSAAMTGVAALLAVALVLQPDAEVVERVVYAEAEADVHSPANEISPKPSSQGEPQKVAESLSETMVASLNIESIRRREFRDASPYFREVDRLLGTRPDLPREPIRVRAEGSRSKPTDATYQQLLEEMLGSGTPTATEL